MLHTAKFSPFTLDMHVKLQSSNILLDLWFYSCKQSWQSCMITMCISVRVCPQIFLQALNISCPVQQEIPTTVEPWGQLNQAGLFYHHYDPVTQFVHHPIQHIHLAENAPYHNISNFSSEKLTDQTLFVLWDEIPAVY